MNTLRHKNAKLIWFEGEDGWWAILKDGLVIDDCVGVHEETKAKLLSRLNDAKPQYKITGHDDEFHYDKSIREPTRSN